MKHHQILNALIIALLALGFFGAAPQSVKAGGTGVIYTVTSTNDGSDANVGDGVCATSGGSCTLRAAMEEANADAMVNTIYFNLPGAGTHVISISGSTLPAITAQLNLDGTSQPNCAAPCIVLSGAVLGGSHTGLFINTDASTVNGFIITSWSNRGIVIFGNQNVIKGNDIGFWPGNPSNLANNHGIWIEGSNNQIGGSTAAARNVISQNTYDGILVVNGSGNAIQGNYIGTNAAGTSALGNGASGIVVFGVASNTLIGGANNGEGNIISGNGGHGIDSGGTATRILGNFIGTNSANAALGNAEHGIFIVGGTATVGPMPAGNPNRIAFNAGRGIVVNGSSTVATIRKNKIWSNGSLGIDLDWNGVTPNDTHDSDTGPNSGQNFPSISSATSSSHVVIGSLRSRSNRTYTLDFYSSPGGTCDPSHHGEGKVWLGSTSVTTNGSGVAGFSFPTPRAFAVGAVITATATDSNRQTSEFSTCRPAN